jgi:hypothetical protein
MSTQPQIPQNLLRAGFSLVRSTPRRRLIISSQGVATARNPNGEKCGKTDWACRWAPEPICYFNLDRGEEGVVDKLASYGRRIVKYDVVIPNDTTRDEAKKKEVYSKIWDKFEEDFKLACVSKYFRTVVGDTWGELWRLLRLAKFGKVKQVAPENYDEVNALFEEISNYPKSPECGDLNAIYIHKLGKEYSAGGRDKATGKRERGEWTGGYERKGYSNIGAIAQVNLEHYRYPREGSTPGFGIRVINNRLNPECDDVELDDSIDSSLMSFQQLAMELFPGTVEKDWR